MTNYTAGRLGRLVAAGLFIAAVPVFLIATNVRLVINAPVLYSYGFEAHRIPERTGIEKDELLSAASQIRDYFNNDAEILDVQVFQRGVRRGIYNEREILHMRDVKGLVRGVYSVQVLLGVYLAGFVAVGLGVRRRPFLTRLARYSSIGGGITLGLVVLVGAGALVGFERLFLTFHFISFSNDLWQLDPRTDMLIAMFPQGFFFDATLAIAGLTVLEAALLALIAPIGLKWKPWQGRRAGLPVPVHAPDAGG